MKLQQFFFTVFPRMSRSKSEKSRPICLPLSKSTELNDDPSGCGAEEHSSNPGFVQSLDSKDAFENSEVTPTLIQTFQYGDQAFESAEQTPTVAKSFLYDSENVDRKRKENTKRALKRKPYHASDQSSHKSLDGDTLVRTLNNLEPKGCSENEFSGLMFDSRDGEMLCSLSRSRSKIRTNPWLASPTKVQQHIDRLESGITISASAVTQSLPTTPIENAFHKVPGGKVLRMDGKISNRMLLERKEFGLSLLLQKPETTDDSASEGYATSLLRSPSFTDMESGFAEGGTDSALASSVSSESDFELLDRSLPHASRECEEFDPYLGYLETTPERHQIDERLHGDGNSGKADRSDIGGKEETKRSFQEKISNLNSSEERSMRKSRNSSNGAEKDVNTISRPDSRRESNLLTVSESASRNNNSQRSKKTVNGLEQRRQLSKITSDGKELKFDLIRVDIDPKSSAEEPGKETSDNLSPRSLVEVSKSLQEKVERLHEQKYYVDAIFHRAREADEQRATQFAKLRSQFVAGKKQTMLQKLLELQKMLGNQSSRLQVVYDAVLSRQWPKIFSKF